jgi:hypothetical protein
MTKKNVETHPFISVWRKFAKKNGACVQCQNPWYDGMCNCKFGEEYKTISFAVGEFACNLMNDGWLP